MSERWANLLVRLGTFLASSAAVQGLNVLTGLTILWVLPMEQYALYISCAALIAMGSVGSDAGISQALLTFGSRAVGDRRRVADIFLTCAQMRRQALVWVSVLVLLAAVAMGHGQSWPPMTWLSVLALVTATNWAQVRLSPYGSLFNVFQDTRSIFVSTAIPAGLRLAATWLVCLSWPTAVAALVVNLLGFVVQDAVSRHRARVYMHPEARPDAQLRGQVRSFVVPLLPGVVYFIFQGQIAVFLLTSLAQTQAVAEVGALGRLQQVFILLGALNSFFVQPHFARLTARREFVRRFGLLALVLGVFAVLVMASGWWFSDAWLFLLGPNYGHVRSLIPLALAGCLAVMLGSTVYSVVVATRHTRYQWLQIPLGLGSQAWVVLTLGVQSSHDALVLTYAPALSYLALQLALLTIAVRRVHTLAPGTDGR